MGGCASCMTWVRTDDGMPLHPKVLELGPAAGWLWLCGISHCNRHTTDGFIKKSALSSLYPSDEWTKADQKRAAKRLVEKGFWFDEGESWRVHDYHEYQEEALKENVLERREQGKERKRRERERKKAERLASESQRDSCVASVVTPPVTSAPSERGQVAPKTAPAPTMSQPPDPSRPDPDPSRPEERENAPAPAPVVSPLDDLESRAAAATTALRVAFAQRYHDARNLLWNRAGDPAVPAVGLWLAKNVKFEELDGAIGRILDRFFADAYVVKRDYPVGLLEKQVSALLDPPKALRDVRKGFCEPSPASAFKNPTDLDKVFGPETPAAGGARR